MKTYKQQFKVCVEKTLECSGVLALEDTRLQQVDETEDMTVEQHVVAGAKFVEREMSSALKQRTQSRQLPAMTISKQANKYECFDMAQLKQKSSQCAVVGLSKKMSSATA